jgi:putative DNA primase/helicase
MTEVTNMPLEKVEYVNWDETELAPDAPLTELGMARRLVAIHGDTMRHSPELRLWLIWNGSQWVEDITGEVQRKVKDIIDRLHGQARFDPDRRAELTRAWLKFQSAARVRAIVELASTELTIL